MRTSSVAANPSGGTTPSGTAAEFVPHAADLETLHEAAEHCTGCDLFRNATQVVFGRGPVPASLMLVGEQPGDREDVEGEPFVGGGKRRLHERPNPAEVRACRPWLEAELGLIEPEIVVLLGATAAQSILGPSFRVTVDHGRLLDSPLPVARHVLATLDPSAIFRSRTDEERDSQMHLLIDDLRHARDALRH